MRVTSDDFTDMDWAPEGGDEPGYYKNAFERNCEDWGQYSMTGASVLASEVSGVLILLDVTSPFVDYNRALSNNIAFECQTVVVMCPNFFRGTPWVPVDVNDTKKDDDNNKDYVDKDTDSRSYEEWRSLHDDYRFNVNVRAAAATLRERYDLMLVAVFGTCYGGGRVLEAAVGCIPSPPSRAVVVGSKVDNNNIREVY